MARSRHRRGVRRGARLSRRSSSARGRSDSSRAEGESAGEHVPPRITQAGGCAGGGRPARYDRQMAAATAPVLEPPPAPPEPPLAAAPVAGAGTALFAFKALRDGKTVMELSAFEGEEQGIRVETETDRERPAPAGVELTDPTVRPRAARRPPPFDLYRPRSPRACPPCSTTRRRRCGTPRGAPLRISAAAAWPASGPRSTRRASPRSTRRRWSARHRERRERLRGRLLRPARLPGPVAAVLQADDGRRLRAGLRGGAGLPGRAARHRPPPRAVHEPRRRARLHRATTAT